MANTSTSYEKNYAKTKERIIRVVMLVGIAATLVGGMYNAYNGYSGWPVYVHVVGFLLLSTLLIAYQRIGKNALLATVFGYFCFIYTPFAWITLMGLYSSMTYVIYVFFLLIAILLDGAMNTVFTVAYFVEIVGLVIENVLARPVENPPTAYFPLAFSYIIMLCVLIFVTRTYKRQFMSFLQSSHHASVTDRLTGLRNHRFLTDVMDEVEAWYLEAPGRDYAIAVIDLDDFKRINDEYGHGVGDEVLSEFGRIMQDAFPGHIVGRYGGDEFMAVFQDLPFDRCVDLCEALRSRVSARRFSDGKIALTLSIGLCGRSQSKGRGSLFTEADALLYAAKERSKNAVGTMAST